MNPLLRLIIVVMMLVTGCTTESTTPQKPATVVVLVDISGSTRTPEMRSLYKKAFREILRSLRPGDVLTVSLITDKSIAELDLPVNERFPDGAFDSDNSLILRGKRAAADSLLAQRKQAIAALFDSLVHATQRRVNRTDIVSSLHVAERCFKSNPGTLHQLVILSDMIQASHDINFNSASLAEPKRSRILRMLEKHGRLADLRNVRVSVVGATAPDLKRYYDIREFWLELFSLSGALLPPEQYGSAAIAFNTQD